MPFSKQPVLVPWHCYKTNHWLALGDGFPDPGLPLVLLGRALIAKAGGNEKEKGKTGKNHDITVLYFSGTLSALYVENQHDVKTSENRTRF